MHRFSLKFSSLVRHSLLGLASLWLVACASTDNSSVPKPQTHTPLTGETALQKLSQNAWKLIMVQEGNALPVARLKAGIPANHIQLSITNTQLSVSGGCNTMRGELSANPHGLFIIKGLAIVTKKACGAELMQADNEIRGYLQRVMYYEVSNQRLKLITGSENLSFIDATLKP